MALKEAVVFVEGYDNPRFPIPPKFEAGYTIFGKVVIGKVESIDEENVVVDCVKEQYTCKNNFTNLKVGDLVPVNTRKSRICDGDEMVKAWQAHSGTYFDEDALKGVEGISF